MARGARRPINVQYAEYVLVSPKPLYTYRPVTIDILLTCFGLLTRRFNAKYSLEMKYYGRCPTYSQTSGLIRGYPNGRLRVFELLPLFYLGDIGRYVHCKQGWTEVGELEQGMVEARGEGKEQALASLIRLYD